MLWYRKQLEETVRIARSDSEMLRAEFDEMSRANQTLIADNDKLKAHMYDASSLFYV